jgi:hypothetical protein
MLSLLKKLRINHIFQNNKINLIKIAENNKKFISSKMESKVNNNSRLASVEDEQELKKLMTELNITDSNMPEVHKKNIKTSSFGGRIRVGALLASDAEKWVGKVVTVGGWIKTLRVQGGGEFAFVELNDGSTIKGIQIVVNKSISNFAAVIKEGIGSCFQVKGLVVKSQGSKQPVSL